jgi:asparagine synthase (glutamine-hydrolysing)
MCGIAGLLNLDGRPVDRELLTTLTDRLAHRGPDGRDQYVDNAAGLGHRRLAIIDLELGRQPMSNEDGSTWLVANGEIYNFRELRQELSGRGYRFRTNSDCEVIIHGYDEWGIDVVNRLRGMFAFAIWDAKKQQMVLARDRIGIKPLCYYLDDRRFAFASELQALTVMPAFDREVDLNALDKYLHLQYIPAPETIYSRIRKLPPGHTLVIGADGRRTGPTRYWRFEWKPDDRLSEAQWVEALDASLKDAVKSHLVADVPFGAFLSGGVDSSTVVAYAARELESPLQTFTVGFDMPDYDERAVARQVSDIVGTRHQEQMVGLDALGLLPKLVHHYGEPFADSSAVCTWRVCEAARQRVTMVLSGDGGDEVFAGYSYFSKIVENFPPLTGTIRKLRRSAGNLLRRRGWLGAVPDVAESWHGRSPWFDETRRQQLWQPGFQHLLGPTRAWNDAQFQPHERLDVLSRCQQVDIETYLPFSNLTKVDIASMAHGLEVRVPLLDHKLLETVARIPSQLRLRKLRDADGIDQWCGKYILKKAAARYLPWELLNRPKVGFSIPIGEWLGGDNKDQVRQRLLDSDSGLDGWFERSYLETLIAEHGVRTDHGHRLWSLLVLAQWRRQSAA